MSKKSSRDNFKHKTINTLAQRAGWKCTICKNLTTGPSQDDETKSYSIGVAAHIRAAAPLGPRYCDKMSREERIDISNGIWLCQNDSKRIDADVSSFPPEELLRLKREHETLIKKEMLRESVSSYNKGLIALGQDLILIGELRVVIGKKCDLHVYKFLVGKSSTLKDFSINFKSKPIYDRFIIVNELGYGRLLSEPPIISETDFGWCLSLQVCEPYLRISPEPMPGDLKLDDKGDLVIENGDLVITGGLGYLPQLIKASLSFHRGEWFLDHRAGSKVREYFTLLADSPWLVDIVKLEVIRMSSIPELNREGQLYLPLPCISRVLDVESLSAIKSGKLAAFRLNLELEDKKQWHCEVEISI